MSRKQNKPRITQDEIDEFRNGMAGVTRYAHEKYIPRAPKAKPTVEVKPSRRKSPPPSPRPKSPPPRNASARAGVLRDATAQGEYVEFARGGLQSRAFRRLKRGEHRIHDNAMLDLHERTTAEAEKLLADFLRAASANGKSPLLIIHGKGLHSGGRRGVMKGFVVEWLKSRAEVKAFCSAVQRDGGTGAVYVLVGRGR